MGLSVCVEFLKIYKLQLYRAYDHCSVFVDIIAYMGKMLKKHTYIHTYLICMCGTIL